MAKLTKNKKDIESQNQKTSDALQAEEDKVNHLTKLKTKLEHSLDDMEETLQREKKMRGDVEKVKRKLEQDLKITQEAVEELERIKREMEDTIKRYAFTTSNIMNTNFSTKEIYFFVLTYVNETRESRYYMTLIYFSGKTKTYLRSMPKLRKNKVLLVNSKGKSRNFRYVKFLTHLHI